MDVGGEYDADTFEWGENNGDRVVGMPPKNDDESSQVIPATQVLKTPMESSNPTSRIRWQLDLLLLPTHHRKEIILKWRARATKCFELTRRRFIANVCCTVV
ncbi:hypothetical protein QE152_g15222 [Popillia japonica]|uniref:Uncharacterized protein n=1 Tax=Popillia japonica TaxID=7064 RepID=A0AAW1L6L8_POPJA